MSHICAADPLIWGTWAAMTVVRNVLTHIIASHFGESVIYLLYTGITFVLSDTVPTWKVLKRGFPASASSAGAVSLPIMQEIGPTGVLAAVLAGKMGRTGVFLANNAGNRPYRHSGCSIGRRNGQNGRFACQ